MYFARLYQNNLSIIDLVISHLLSLAGPGFRLYGAQTPKVDVKSYYLAIFLPKTEKN